MPGYVLALQVVAFGLACFLFAWGVAGMKFALGVSLATNAWLALLVYVLVRAH